jgi:uncharacterized metal-binding protein
MATKIFRRALVLSGCCMAPAKKVLVAMRAQVYIFICVFGHTYDYNNAFCLLDIFYISWSHMRGWL